MFETVKYSKFTISFVKICQWKEYYVREGIGQFWSNFRFCIPWKHQRPKGFLRPCKHHKTQGFWCFQVIKWELWPEMSYSWPEMSYSFIVFYYLPHYIIYLKEGSRLIISVAYRCFLSLIAPFNEISFKLTAIDYFPLFCDD